MVDLSKGYITGWSFKKAQKVKKLIIFCSDPNYRKNIEEFADWWGECEPVIRILVPGGQLLVLEEWDQLEDPRSLPASILYLIDKFGVETVAVVGHQDCAWYSAKYPKLERQRIEEQARADALDLAENIQEQRPGLVLQALYGVPVPDSGVEFTLIREFSPIQ